MNKALGGLVALILVLVGVLLVKAALHTPQSAGAVATVSVEVDAEAAAVHLAEAIRFKTVSTQDPAGFAAEEFLGFIDWVQQAYPEFHDEVAFELSGAIPFFIAGKGRTPHCHPS